MAIFYPPPYPQLPTKIAALSPFSTTTQTITGVSRISGTTTRNQTGVARIQQTVSQTQTGLARISISTQQNQTGKAAVQSTTQQNQTGKSAIQNTTTRTQTGLARISISTQQTQSGKAAIQNTTTKTQTGVARITASTTRTQGGKAAVQNTTTKTQTGVSRIVLTTTRNQTGVARIVVSTSRNQTGISRITATTTQTQTGKAAIRNTTTRTQTGVANIIEEGSVVLEVVQSEGVTSNTGTAEVVLAPTTSGNLIVINIAIYEGTIGTISDSGDHTWLPAFTRDAQFALYQYYCPNIVGESTPTFTVTSGASYVTISVIEISGADTIDPLGDTTVSGSPSASGSYSTDDITVEGYEILIGAATSGNPTDFIPDVGWTEEDNFSTSGSAEGLMTASKIVSVPDDYPFTYTTSIAVITSHGVAAYRAAESGNITTTKTQTGVARITSSTQRTQTGVAAIQNTTTRTQTGVARIQITTVQNQIGVARIVADTSFSREALLTLPTDNINLGSIYSSGDETDVSTDNGVRVGVTGVGFLIHQFKAEGNNNTSPISIVWNGQGTLAPSTATVYLQIYNVSLGGWETLDSNSTASANTDFTLDGIQTIDVEDYYDSNFVVSVRVYQEN